MVEWVTSLITSLGYGGVFLLMFIETIFPPIPSEIVMSFAGFAASQGALGLWQVIVWATAGSLLGSVSLYSLGKLLKEHHVEAFVQKRGKYIGVNSRQLHTTQRWFDRHGYLAVLLCRLLPGIRSLISIPAGMRKLRPVPFLIYSAIGTGVWNTLLGVGGYILGEEYQRVEEHLEPIGLILLIVIAAGLTYLLVRRLRAGTTPEEELQS